MPLTATEPSAPPLSETDPRSTHPAWHVDRPDAIASRLRTGTQGLTREEAHLRLTREGPNQLPETAPTSPSTSAFAARRVNEKLEMSVPHSRVRLPHQSTADQAEDISSEDK